MAYDNELVLKAVKAYVAAGIAAALNTVEAEFTATDPVTLPDPVTYFEGYKPTFLDMESAEFPLVAVLAMERRPEAGGTNRAAWGYQEQVISCVVNFVVVADDEEGVNKVAQRYARALCALLDNQRVFEGFQQVDWNPAAILSPAIRHAKTFESDMQQVAETDFIMAGAIEMNLEG